MKLEYYEKEKIKILLEDEKIIKDKGDFLLLYAVKYGYYRSVRQMLPFIKDKVIDIDTTDEDQNSPLHFAVIKKEYEILGLLLRNDAEMLSINKHELMPVDYIGNNNTMERIFTNFNKMWVTKKLRSNK